MNDPFTMALPNPDGAVAAPLTLDQRQRVTGGPARAEPTAQARSSVPSVFVYETEHPVLPIPFKVTMGDVRLTGTAISVTAAYVAISGPLDPAWNDHRQVVTVQFDFDGFSVTLFPDVVVAGSRRSGDMSLQFMDPAGAHLPQLRFIINSYIAGDFVSMNGLMSYTGPTRPTGAKGGEAPASRRRVRSAAVAFLSLCVIFAAVNILFTRATPDDRTPTRVHPARRPGHARHHGRPGHLSESAGPRGRGGVLDHLQCWRRVELSTAV